MQTHDQHILDYVSDLIILTDSSSAITYIGPGVKETLGFCYYDVLRMDSVAQFFQIAGLDREDLSSADTIKDEEIILHSKNGDARHFLLNKIPFGDTDTLWKLTDITEKKKLRQHIKSLQEQFFQSQKNDAIRTLAAGIAHEFNNILGAILLTSEIVLRNISEDTTNSNRMREIIRSSKRAASLVDQLLTFSRNRKSKSIQLQLTPILKEIAKSLSASSPDSLEIKTAFNAKNDTVEADAVTIYQLIVNLATNALDAMQKTGVLTLSTNNISLRELPVDENNSTHEEYVNIEIHDTGTGMSAETVQKAFDPFYTTKQSESALGLGLSVADGIVKSIGGLLLCESTVGVGTKIKVILPCHHVIAQQTAELSETQGGKHHGRLLIVDDERPLIKAYKTVLEQNGYTVTAEENSQKALEEFEKNPDEFSLVFTDYAMKELTGPELITRIKELRPEIPVILSTGYKDHIGKDMLGSLKVASILYKPVALNKLICEIENAITQNGN